jgi:hypothetical protein
MVLKGEKRETVCLAETPPNPESRGWHGCDDARRARTRVTQGYVGHVTSFRKKMIVEGEINWSTIVYLKHQCHLVWKSGSIVDQLMLQLAIFILRGTGSMVGGDQRKPEN